MAVPTLQLLPLLALAAPSVAYAPLFDAFGQPGGDAQKCSGAQVVRTATSLLVWGTCGGGAGVANRSVWLRKSLDWGESWHEPVLQPHLGGLDLAQFIYDPSTDAILSMAPPPGRGGRCVASPSCPNPYSCLSKSTDDGETWSASKPAGCRGNSSGGGSGEGCVGIALSTGTLLSPAGFGVGNSVIIGQDGGATWRPGNVTPPLPSKQGWGEAAVAELANGSVVLTSRLAGVRKNPHWEFLPIQRGFSISHTGGRTWAKSWSFPAAQPYDVNFGPGYNVEHGLASAHSRSRLLLSKPTATLHGDSSGTRPQCGPHTQGSCAYRRNLTVAASSDGGASWTIEPWGLIYKDRAAYSALVELPNGKIAVVFERSNSSLDEYRYVSVAIVTPSWAMQGEANVM